MNEAPRGGPRGYGDRMAGSGPGGRRAGVVACVLASLTLALAAPTAGAQQPPLGAGVDGSDAGASPALARGPISGLSSTWSARRWTADGVRQWIACAGHGPVTIVVIAGLHADHTMWSLVLDQFARTTRTCIYDRPGLGSSPPRSPHAIVDAATHADELESLLGAAHVTGPLIVMGHSYGGLVARSFVARYRTRVAGLMLIEGVAPHDNTSHYWGEGGDGVDIWRSSTAAARMRLRSIPLVVLAAQDPDRSYWGGPSYGETPQDLADWRAHQQAAASLSTQSTFLIVRRSAHVIEVDRPDAVVAGVRLLVHAVVSRTRLPRCALGRYGTQPLCG